MRKGIAVSPGVAVGTAYCIGEIFVRPDAKRLHVNEISAELARYETARDRTAKDLRQLQQKVERQIGHEEAAIFGVHESILHDTAFSNKIRMWIVNERLTAQAALHRLVNHYTELFGKTKDEYLKERLNDVRDVVIRLSNYLTDVNEPQAVPKGPLILVAAELLPSQVVAFEDHDIRGLITESGSQTSHAAIIARSRGIPAVSGVPGILKMLNTGDTVVVDGRDGHIAVNTDSESLTAYRKLEREFFHLKDQLAENRDHPAVTADGVKIELLANINNLDDTKAAVAMGAAGVGLYRTEYLYLAHPGVPSEDEQLKVYSAVIRETPGQQVTFRTLDIGGDKTVPYLGRTQREANPFMGWRSIRLSFEHPEMFAAQLRAVMRAAAEAGRRDARIRLMFPMITTVEEMRRVRGVVRRVIKQLKGEGQKFREVPIGMMLEVPAAAVSIDTMLDVADFVSIGSNDLVQYLMAADRDNPKVSHLCQPLAPAVLRVLRHVIVTCNERKKKVTLCGEMAGQPSAFALLLGMGLRSFSMSPAFVPTIKELASKLTVEKAEQIFERAVSLKTTAQVKSFMRRQIAEVSPEIALLDMI